MNPKFRALHKYKNKYSNSIPWWFLMDENECWPPLTLNVPDLAVLLSGSLGKISDLWNVQIDQSELGIQPSAIMSDNTLLRLYFSFFSLNYWNPIVLLIDQQYQSITQPPNITPCVCKILYRPILNGLLLMLHWNGQQILGNPVNWSGLLTEVWKYN